jgi:hypothetical protein
MHRVARVCVCVCVCVCVAVFSLSLIECAGPKWQALKGYFFCSCWHVVRVEPVVVVRTTALPAPLSAMDYCWLHEPTHALLQQLVWLLACLPATGSHAPDNCWPDPMPACTALVWHVCATSCRLFKSFVVFVCSPTCTVLWPHLVSPTTATIFDMNSDYPVCFHCFMPSSCYSNATAFGCKCWVCCFAFSVVPLFSFSARPDFLASFSQLS